MTQGKGYELRAPCILAPLIPSVHSRYCRYHMQALQGDNATERPMWAEKGGLDFEGRARWDAWAALKVCGGRVGGCTGVCMPSGMRSCVFSSNLQRFPPISHITIEECPCHLAGHPRGQGQAGVRPTVLRIPGQVVVLRHPCLSPPGLTPYLSVHLNVAGKMHVLPFPQVLAATTLL